MAMLLSVGVTFGYLLGPRTPSAHGTRGADAQVSMQVVRVNETNAKDELLLIASQQGLKAMDDGTRQLATECILMLERASPTPEPTSSSLLNGVWKLSVPSTLGKGFFDSPTRELALTLYTAGYSPGTLLQLFGKLPNQIGVSLTDVTVQIQSPEVGQPRVTTTVAVSAFGEERESKLYSNLLPVSGVRLREDIIEAEVLGRRTLLPGPLARSRTLFVTYLDGELLIARDDSGCAEVLVRKQDMRFSSGADLSDKVADDAPGAS